ALECTLSLRTRMKELVAVDRRIEFERLVAELDLEFIEDQIPAAIEQSVNGVEHICNIVQAMKFFSHDQRPNDLTVVDINVVLKNVATVATGETKYVADVVLELG